MSSSDRQVYVITLADQVQPDSIIGQLQSCGVEVKEVLAALGQIIAQGSEPAAEQVRALDAVISVDAQRTYRALGDH